MQTKIYSPNEIDTGLSVAVEQLQQDEVVAFPTETVYGLGARIFSPEAIARIYDVKGRPSDNPLIAHISNIEQVHQIAQNIPDDFFTLTNEFWPGPLTIVIPKHPNVPDIATAGLPTIGLRMPNHPIALTLIEHLGEPVVAPSANLSGKPSPTQAQHVLEDLDGKIEVIIDGGKCEIGIESTIVDLTTDQPTILRPGAITQQELASALGRDVLVHLNQSTDKQSNYPTNIPKAPGMKYRHYAPTAKITVIEEMNDEVREKMEEHASSSVILSSDTQDLPTNIPVWPLSTNTLFSAFRDADAKGFSHIFVRLNTSQKHHAGLVDRISKASRI